MNKNKLIRFTSLIMSVSIVALTFFSTFVMPAGAAFSLQNIEEIKETKQLNESAFRIVEIAPSADTGSMCYYVDGQEPGNIANWENRIANMPSAGERTNHVNSILNSLSGKSVASVNPDSAPIHILGSYVEHYPWQKDNNGNFIGEAAAVNTIKLNLSSKEAFVVNEGKIREYPEDQKGGNYDVTYDYFLSNVFDFNTWASNSVNYETKGTKTAGDSITINRNKKSIRVVSDGDNGNDFYTDYGAAERYYHMDVEPNTKYTLSYTLTGHGKSRVFVFGYKSNLTAYNSAILSGTIVNSHAGYVDNPSDNVKCVFVTGAETTKLCIRFGAGSQNEDIEYSNITICKDDISNNIFSDVKYVQNIDYFKYGEADTVYGDNLFDFNKWATNDKSFNLNHKTGTSITPNYEDASVTVTNNGTGTDNNNHNLYTSYDASFENYFMVVEPNTKYRVSYDVDINEGNGQFFVFVYGSNMKLDTSNSGATLTKEGGTPFWHLSAYPTQSKTYTEYITTNNQALYFQIRLGSSTTTANVKFSNIKIQKVENPKNYYYDVTPTEYVYPTSLPEDGTKLYTQNDEGIYEYYGRFGDDGVRPHAGTAYYSLEIADSCYPSTSFDETHPYCAVSSSFREASPTVDETTNLITGYEKAYFRRTYAYLTYVGEGLGNADLIKGPDRVVIYTEKVFYTGGYENNNWFKYRVLDADDKNADGTDKYTFPITVTTITPDDPNLNSTLVHADLIVISGGFDPLNTGVRYKTPITNVDGTTSIEVKDIPSENLGLIKSTILDYIDNKMPVILDSDLLTGSDCPTNLKSIVQSITTDSAGRVDKSVYVFNKAQLGVSNLSNGSFVNEIDAGLYSSGTSPFYRVYDELDHESSYRLAKAVAPLTDAQKTISQATIIRYIINYQNQRYYQSLNTIKVLDIEPLSTTPGFTLEMLNAMMPDNSGFSADKVNIVTMSTAELIGKNDDFSEEYDLIYIGTNITNMNYISDNCNNIPYRYTENGEVKEGTLSVVNGVFDATYTQRVNNGQTKKLYSPKERNGDGYPSPVYNDTNMNGMYYTNVGDKVTTNSKSVLSIENGIEYPPLSGLLAEDYVNIGDKIDDLIAGDSLLKKLGGYAANITLKAINIDSHVKYWVKGGHATFRTTGSDINLATMEKLQKFIDAGRPVVVSNDLTTKGYEQTFTATATMTLNTSKSTDSVKVYNLTCDLDQTAPVGATVTYQWYYDNGKKISPYNNDSADSKTVELKIERGTPTYDKGTYIFNEVGLGTYYCEVHIKYNGNWSVKSNTCRLLSDMKDYRVYLRAKKTSSREYFGLKKRDVFEYYVWLRDGLPNGWYCTYGWRWKNILNNWEKKIDGTGQSYKSQVEEVRVEVDFYNQSGIKMNGSDAVTKKGYKNGIESPSYTRDLFSVIDGDYSESLKPFPSGSNNEFYWRDLSVNDAGLGDYVTSKNGRSLEVPFIFTLGEIKAPEMDYSKKIPTTIKVVSELSQDAIDNCSYMYQFISKNYYQNEASICGADNMFSFADAKDNKRLLKNSLEIAKPIIEFNTEPKEYPQQLIGSTLNFSYYITDESNPYDPKQKTYTEYFYADTNGDGKFSVDELIGSSREVKFSKKDSQNLISFSFNFNTNPDFNGKRVGLIPWKLEVVFDTKTEHVSHPSASYTGYAYIKPDDDPIAINAVMILPGSWVHNYISIEDAARTGYTWQAKNKNGTVSSYTMKPNSKTIFSGNEYIGCIFESPVFDDLENLRRLSNEELGVGDDGIGIDGLYHLGFDCNNGDIRINIAVTNIHDLNIKYKENKNSDFLNQYNMLIMGFGDDWGKLVSTWNDDIFDAFQESERMQKLIENTQPEGFELNTALAIVDYIRAGNPTLFCHDTLNKNVNFVNLYWDKLKNELTKISSTITGWYNGIIDSINGAIRLYNKAAQAVNNLSLKLFKKGNVMELIEERKPLTTNDFGYADSRVNNGYWNNLIMRDALGLDRCGITYAIKTRAEAIYSGDDKDSVNQQYRKENLPNDSKEDGMYCNEVVGRAHMYEYIYNYKYSDKLTVENMLDSGYSVTWIPGSAVTYSRPENFTDEDGNSVGQQEIIVYGGDKKGDETIIDEITTNYYQGLDEHPAEKTIIQSVASYNPVTVSITYPNDVYEKYNIFGKPVGNPIHCAGDTIKWTADDSQAGYCTPGEIGLARTRWIPSDVGITYKEVGRKVTSGDVGNQITINQPRYRYVGSVYNKVPKEHPDEYDGHITYVYEGRKEPGDVVVYNGQNVYDENGNIIAEWDEYSQGFTDYAIQRYIDTSQEENRFQVRNYLTKFTDRDKDTGIIAADKITQVNKGRITTYPYDINNDDMFNLNQNTADYREALDTTFSIKTTHEQVYQCNMNGDDITVWYCMSGNGKTGNEACGNDYYNPTTDCGIRNDCANAYYIYSRKNLTYTGAGHTNSFSPFEAKLFINTLVSAYRSEATAPRAAYATNARMDANTGSYNYSIQKYLQIVPKATEVSTDTFEEKLTPTSKVHFIIESDNSVEDLSAVFYFIDKDGKLNVFTDGMGTGKYKTDNNKDAIINQLKESIDYDGEVVEWNDVKIKLYKVDSQNEINYAETSSATSLGRLDDKVVYAYDLPDEFVDLFNPVEDGGQGYETIKLKFMPRSYIPNQDSEDGAKYEVLFGDEQVLEIRKLKLSDLS